MADTTNQDATGQTETPTVSEPQESPQPPTEQKTSGLPDDAEQLKAIIHKLRSENAKDRTDAKATAAQEAQKNLIDKIGRALGIITDDKTPSAEELTSTLAASQDEARQARIELAVYKAANGKADPDALLDSQAFQKTISDIDPANGDQLAQTIDQFIADNPRFKPVQVTGSSAVDHPAGSGETPPQSKTIQEAVTRALSA